MTVFPRWIVFLALTVVLAACHGSQQTDAETGATNDTSETEAGATIPEDRASPPTDTPPPRTARVQGRILSCQTGSPDAKDQMGRGSGGEGTTRCTIRIDEVLAYGMSAPPVAPGTRTVGVRSVVLRDRTIDDLTSEKALVLSIEHAGPGLEVEGEKTVSPQWTLTSVSGAS